MELSFSDIEDGTEDVPAKANELLSRVHKLKDVMKMVRQTGIFAICFFGAVSCGFFAHGIPR